jgi:hypothetical protein
MGNKSPYAGGGVRLAACLSTMLAICTPGFESVAQQAADGGGMKSSHVQVVYDP